MLREPIRIAWSEPGRIARLGRNHNRLARMAVFEQEAGTKTKIFRMFVAMEIQCPESGAWVRQPGGEVCEILVAAIMAASNARILNSVAAHGVTVATVEA